MKYHEMTKNYVFRELECGLSVEETAELCFKSVRTVKEWDKGKTIPKECRRLMRRQKRLELSHDPEWDGFRMNNRRLELPTGRSVTPQEILTGIGLLEIGYDMDIRNSLKLLKIARAIAKLMSE